MGERSTGLNDFEVTDSTAITRATNALTNDVVLLCSRYEQALDVLEQWLDTAAPAQRALALRTRALLRRGGRSPEEDSR